MNRQLENRIAHASGEELLLIAVLGDRRTRTAVDRELERRSCTSDCESNDGQPAPHAA